MLGFNSLSYFICWLQQNSQNKQKHKKGTVLIQTVQTVFRKHFSWGLLVAFIGLRVDDWLDQQQAYSSADIQMIDWQ